MFWGEETHTIQASSPWTVLTPLGFTLETAALAAHRIPCWLSIQADVMGLYMSVEGAPVLLVTESHP